MPALPPIEETAFGVYVHWPFCLHKCPYCDFNSHVREKIDEGAWQAAYIKEISRLRSVYPGRPITSVFFGGGTPSLMAAETVATILGSLESHWGFADGIEITLEGNPTSIEAQKYASFRAAGVNRASLGLQALDDNALKALGREHSVAEGLEALTIAKEHFDRVSFDLIYAREGHRRDAWEKELVQALTLAGDHLSLYQLTIERGTQFFQRWQKGTLETPGEDEEAALYELTQSLCDAAGLPAYEISNHARPGAEARHNLTYWRYQDYLGVGPGAHGRLSFDGTRFAMNQVRSPEAWLNAVDLGNGTAALSPLDRSAQAEEMLMMGLRTTEGVDRQRFHQIIGSELIGEILIEADVMDLVEGGLLHLSEQHLCATETGRPVLNALLQKLLV